MYHNLRLQLDQKKLTAKVINSPEVFGNMPIPRSIQYESQEYIITSIGEASFKNNKNINFIIFDENSEVNSICSEAFSDSTIFHIFIPEKVVELKDGWCYGTPNLYKISLSQENHNYKYIDVSRRIICGKTEPKSDNYDSVLFASRRVMTAKIPSYITRIKSFSFSYCKSLKEITFSEDSKLNVIEKNAFSNSSIERIFIPKNASNLEEGWCHLTLNLNHVLLSKENVYFSFIDEEQKIISRKENNSFETLIFASRDVTKAIIPSSIKRICPFSFSFCKQLKTVKFSDDSKLNSIGSSSFANSSIEEIKIPAETEIIEDSSFKSSSLKSIIIPEKVTFIGNFAFHQCNNLRVLEFSPDSKLNSIGKHAFSFTSIEYLSIPLNVQKIDDFAFYGCKNLKSVKFQPNSKLSSIGKEAFSHTLIEYVFIPANVNFIGNGAFSFCKKMKNFEFEPNSKLNSISDYLFSKSLIESIKIPASIQVIGKNSFQKCFNLMSIEFSEDSQLHSICESAFCKSSIKSISIPSSCNKIEKHAFSHCKLLKTVDFSKVENLEVLEDEIFSHSSIEFIEIPSSVTVIGNKSFSYCQKLASIQFPENSKLYKIDDSAFEFCSLKGITIPSSVQNIERYAFLQCKLLKRFEYAKNSQLLEVKGTTFSQMPIERIVIPSKVKTIQKNSFFCCNSLKSVEFEPNSELELICNEAFAFSNVQTVSFPENLSRVEEGAFCKAQNLTDIFIPKKNRYFHFTPNKILLYKSDLNSQFYDEIVFSHSARKVNIPSYVKRIESYAFYESEIAEISFLVNSELLSIGKFSFFSTYLGSITIPSSVVCIEERAFSNCFFFESGYVFKEFKAKFNWKIRFRQHWN